MKEKKEIGIEEVRRRLDRACAVQDLIADLALGAFVALVIFGIGFTCGYYHPR